MSLDTLDSKCGGNEFYNFVEWTLSRYLQSLPSIFIAYFIFGKSRTKKVTATQGTVIDDADDAENDDLSD